MEGTNFESYIDMVSNMTVIEEMPSNETMNAQYDVIYGRMPSEDAADEIILFVDSRNQIVDFMLLALGIVEIDTNTSVLKIARELDKFKDGLDFENLVYDGEEDEASARMRAQFSAALSARSGDQEVEEEEEEFLNLDDLDALLEQLSGQGGGEIPQIQRSAEGFAPFPAECAPELPVQKTAQVRAYNAKEDLKYIVQQGPRNGLHFLLCVSSYADFKQVGIREEAFRHRLTFRISADESRLLFGTAAASSLAEHVCLYTDTIDRYSFRPYLHPGVSWDGWSVAEDGTVISPFT